MAPAALIKKPHFGHDSMDWAFSVRTPFISESGIVRRVHSEYYVRDILSKGEKYAIELATGHGLDRRGGLKDLHKIIDRLRHLEFHNTTKAWKLKLAKAHNFELGAHPSSEEILKTIVTLHLENEVYVKTENSTQHAMSTTRTKVVALMPEKQWEYSYHQQDTGRTLDLKIMEQQQDKQKKLEQQKAAAANRVSNHKTALSSWKYHNDLTAWKHEYRSKTALIAKQDGEEMYLIE